MDSTVPASSAPTISVSARQDLQNTFTAKTPRHFEGEFFMEKLLLSFYLGVAVCFLFCQRFHLTGAWAGLLPVCAALVLVNEERVLSREKETEKEEVLRIHA